MSHPDPETLRTLLREANRALKSGTDGQTAIKTLAAGLGALPALTAAEHDKLGRWIRKAFAAGAEPQLTVHLVGQCTTTWIASALMAEAMCRGVLLLATEAEYDQALQASFAPIDADVVILLPWSTRLLSAVNAQEGVESELQFWAAVWSHLDTATRRAGRAQRILQIGYDLFDVGAAGVMGAGLPGGALERIAQVNTGLRRQCPKSAYFLDLAFLSGHIGRAGFYDPRRYHWTKQPFSEQGVQDLAAALWAGLRALLTGPKKVLVLDLDNTLWGGVVGEEGPLGVAIGTGPEGEAFAAFQRHCKALSERGVVLVVASKNNLEDAKEPFERNPEMVLRLEDFAAFEAHWAPKSVSLARMAQTLRLGLDSFVFFDDNPAERALISEQLPEVEVVEVPPEPAEYVRALQAGRWFETLQMTSEDRARTVQYRQEGQRESLKANLGSLDDYLASLKMEASVLAVGETELPRVVQLLGKTNQFNLTTRRHDTQVVHQMQALPRSILLALRVNDRFGDYGLVSVTLALPDTQDPKLLVIDSWLMSCRVIGRGVERFFFDALVEHARAQNFERIFAEYYPTRKNPPIKGLLPELGFVPTQFDPVRRFSGTSDAVSTRYMLSLDGYCAPQSFVTDLLK